MYEDATLAFPCFVTWCAFVTTQKVVKMLLLQLTFSVPLLTAASWLAELVEPSLEPQLCCQWLLKCKAKWLLNFL